jgi:cell wall-associated NlpC family hydrolase
VPPAPPNNPAPGYQVAISYAQAQLGKPYQWGGSGPNSFDCSGLVMMAWAQAGVYFPHLAQDQYDMTERIPLSDLLPGDLVFYGTPDDVYHVGLYIGGGDMIDAPETGQNVQIQSIYWSGLLGAGRVQS